MQLNTARLRLARKVRNFRLERQLSQTALATRASVGVSKRTLQRIEQAAHNPEVSYDPKLSTLVKLSQGLHQSVSTLIGQLTRNTAEV